MPLERPTITLIAGAANPNILAGSIYEFMSRPTRVEVWGSSALATTGIGINFGSRTICQQASTFVPLETGVGLGPRMSEDGIADDIALPGERIVIALQDNGAGSLNRILVRFTEG